MTRRRPPAPPPAPPPDGEAEVSGDLPPREQLRQARARAKALKRGRAEQRAAHLAERRGDIDPRALNEAFRARRRQMGEQALEAPIAEAPARAGGRRATARGAAVPVTAAPQAAQPNLWVPIGPTVVIDGQAGGRPRVAGRVRDLRVSPDGQRVYAATANGGVWYSSDAGDSWVPLGGWTTTGAPPAIDRPAGVLACGCLFVRFDAGGNPAGDEVLVGTGELLPAALTTLSGTPGSSNTGIGILRAVGPATSAIFATPWAVEGNNLAGSGVFRLAADPAAATTFVAATSAGLWTRTGAPAATWTQVAAVPFGGASGAALMCTDLTWAPAQGPTPSRLWVAVRDDVGAASGVWVSANGTAGPFNQIQPAAPPPNTLPGLQASSRISLAVAPSNPAVVYALADGNLVWRIDNVTPTPVQNVPPNLLGGQAAYDQAIAVHPTRPERVVLGGATELADGQWSASLYIANVTGPAGGPYTYGFSTLAPLADPTTDDSYIGHGVHADVHATVFVAVGARVELWVGCDGGVFRSPRGSDDNRLVKNSFVARNNGIAALECGFVAGHPSVDGYMLSGTQDNGTIERIGVNLWRGRLLGDGGGVAFDPAAPNRFIAQYVQADWNDDGAPGTTYVRPALRSNPVSASGTVAEQSEDAAAGFYSGVDAVMVPPVGAGAPTSRLAVGTYRIWYSANWGNSWQTLPSMTDPMALAPPGAQNNNTDPCVTTSGAPDFNRGQVIACRWASPTRLYVLCQREVLKYELLANATATGGLRVTTTALSRQSPAKKQDTQAATAVVSPGQVLPSLGAWSDLAVHQPARGTHGSFYVATTGRSDQPTMDTLWWFDGTNRWHATGLRTDATNGAPAPAYAVMVDPADTNSVYVGTAVGVWRGVFDSAGPSWTWSVFSNGLPEAAVHDLAIHRSGALRLLRAAVQARGVWEVDLAAPTITPATPLTMLRVHAYDTRRTQPTALTDPLHAMPNSALSWHASPDVRVRPRRGSQPPAPTGLPWAGASPDRYGLWVFQNALHARGAGDPLIKPDGQWTPLFDMRLRVANGNSNRINRALWRTVVGNAGSFPDAYATPWNSASPSEADLFELIVDRPAPLGSPASIGLRRVRAHVDVQVHHRHPIAVAGNDVKLTLLMRNVTGTADPAWAALPCAWTAAVQTLLRSGGAVPALADGWSFADTGTTVRSPAAAVDARLSRTVTFDIDLRALAAPARVLLVAVAHSSVDVVTLPGASPTLQNLVLGTRFVALRSVEIV